MHRHYVHSLIALATLAAAAGTGAKAQTHSVYPQDNGAALINPGMGWIFPYYDDSTAVFGASLASTNTLSNFPGLSVAYMRLSWSYLEPTKGNYNWSIIDTPAQTWIAQGKQIAIRVTNTETNAGPNLYYATPPWVKAEGAAGYNFVPFQGIATGAPWWEPKYDDPIFLQELETFIAALATHYDGDPNVAFIDIGSFGVWGEGHTDGSTNLPYSADVVMKHINLYQKYFKKTPLIVNHAFALQGRGTAPVDYARKSGLGFRDDSILVNAPPDAYYDQAMAAGFWGNAPVILESQWQGLISGWNGGMPYLQAIEAYHASYAMFQDDPEQYLQQNASFVASVNSKLGYRFQLLAATWPATVSAGGQITISTQWRNAGVSPPTFETYSAITLTSGDNIAATFVDTGFSLRALQVGTDDSQPGPAYSRQVSFLLPTFLQKGTYQVWISVGTGSGSPQIALPLSAGNMQRRYLLGSMIVD